MVVGVPTDIVMDIVPECDRSLLPTFIRRAQKNLRDDVKCKTDNIEYYNDEEYTDKVESGDNTDSETEMDDDDDDSDDSTFSTDEEDEADEDDSTFDEDDEVDVDTRPGDRSQTDSNEMKETAHPRKKQKCTTDTEQTFWETTTVSDEQSIPPTDTEQTLVETTTVSDEHSFPPTDTEQT
jgi:hypothetical protein